MPSTFKVRLETGNEFGPAEMDVLLMWAQEGRISRGAILVPVPSAGEPASDLIRVMDEPRLAAILSAPPTIGGTLPPRESGDEGVATVIPYRNKPALIGYYLAIVGCLGAILIPILGFAMPIAAIILGTKGLKAVKANPNVHGKVHAYIAIVGGILGTLFAIGNFALVVAVLLSRR